MINSYYYRILPLFIAVGFSVITNDIYDNSWALVIGIDKYQKAPILSYAVQDANSVQSMLINSFGYPPENVVLLSNELATKNNILSELSTLTTKAKSNDRVLIFFAGHGQTTELPDGGEIGYLLPYEGDNDNLYLSSIAMDELEKIALMSHSKHMLFLVDVCYGGIAADGLRSLNPEKQPNYINKIIKNKSRQIITAGGRGEQVVEKSEWGHSAFTKNLLSGLRDWRADSDDDGFITADELGLFLRKHVTIDSDNLQTPVKGRFGSDDGEFIFFMGNNNDVFEDEEEINEDDIQIIEYIKRSHDSDVSFFGHYNTETSEVSVQMYSPTENISGFQFSITGADLSEITGGIAKKAGFVMNSSPSSIGGWGTSSGVYIPNDENRIRSLVTFSLERTSRMVCLDGIMFLDNNGSMLTSNSSECLFTK